MEASVERAATISRLRLDRTTESARLVLTLLSFAGLTVYYGSSINHVVLVLCLFGILLAVSLADLSGLIAQWRRSPAVPAYLAACLMALFAAYQVSLSKENSFAVAVGLMLAPLGFVLGQSLGARYRVVIVVLRWAIVVLASLSCWQFVTAGRQAYAPLTEANGYAALLYLIGLPWMHEWLSGHRGSGLEGDSAARLSLAAGVFGLILLALSATYSRAAFGILILALAIWWALWGLRRRHAIGAGIRIGRLVTLTLLTLCAYLAGDLNSGGQIASDMTSQSVVGGMDIRLVLARAGLDMYLSAPLTGIGLYSYPLIYSQLRGPEDPATAGLFAHNDYVQFLAEGGPMLLGVLLVLVFFVAYRFLRVVWRPGRSRVEEFGLLLGLGAVLGHAAVNFIFYVPVLAFLVGLMAAGIRWAGDHEVGAGPPSGVPRPPVSRVARLSARTVLGCLWVCWLFVCLDAMNSGVLGGQRYVPFADRVRASEGSRLTYAKWSHWANGSWGTPALALARLTEQRLVEGEVPGSATGPANRMMWAAHVLSLYRDAIATDPSNAAAYLMFWQFLSRFPGLDDRLRSDEQPGELLAQALRVDPFHVPTIETVAGQLSRRGHVEAAAAFLLQHVPPRLSAIKRRNRRDAVRLLDLMADCAERLNDTAMLAAVAKMRDGLGEGQKSAPQIWWPDG